VSDKKPNRGGTGAPVPQQRQDKGSQTNRPGNPAFSEPALDSVPHVSNTHPPPPKPQPPKTGK